MIAGYGCVSKQEVFETTEEALPEVYWNVIELVEDASIFQSEFPSIGFQLDYNRENVVKLYILPTHV